jgi:hypothetical protein
MERLEHPGEILSSAAKAQEFAARYKKQLARRDTLPTEGAGSGLESMTGSGGEREPDLSGPAIDERVKSTSAKLHEIVKNLLGDKPELHEIVDKIAIEGHESLKLLGGEIPEELDTEAITAGLEVVVRTDGSRPSFMIRNGEVDTNTSPVGAWADQIAASVAGDLFSNAIACVGRIDVPSSVQGFEGTGFLIAENLIVTNRHVLQAIARPNLEGVWTFKPGVAIDFGHEFRARDSVSPRRLKQVIFAGAKPISSPVDHTKLDMALIELEPAVDGSRPAAVLALDIAPDWANPTQFIYTIGYPGNPGLGEPLSLLEQLFQSTFGCKRLAPGEIQQAHATDVATWTLVHDATTLCGNSGSVVVIPGREQAAAGLHYGGTRADPRENWGHILGRVLNEPDKVSGKPLLECLKQFGVQLIDRQTA